MDLRRATDGPAVRSTVAGVEPSAPSADIGIGDRANRCMLAAAAQVLALSRRELLEERARRISAGTAP